MQKILLHDGNTIPGVGFGVFMIPNDGSTYRAVREALEDAQQAGKIKSMGVDNMTPKIWQIFVPQFDTVPAVNMVECNPFFRNPRRLCRAA